MKDHCALLSKKMLAVIHMCLTLMWATAVCSTQTKFASGDDFLEFVSYDTGV